MFPWPHVYEIWVNYFNSIVNRLKHTKVERVRELFKKCLRSLPATKSEQNDQIGKKGQLWDQGKIFYVLYAQFEERYGLINHSIEIFDRALKDLSDAKL